MNRTHKMVCIQDLTESNQKKTFITKWKCYECIIFDLTDFFDCGIFYEFIGDDGFLNCAPIHDFITLEEYKKKLVKQRFEW